MESPSQSEQSTQMASEARGFKNSASSKFVRWGDILKTSADGVEFLEYTERQTKTRTSAEPKDIRAVKPKMFSVPGSDRDPVQAYHLYASKRSGK